MKTYQRKPQKVRIATYEEIVAAGAGRDEFEFEGLQVEKQGEDWYYVTNDNSGVASITPVSHLLILEDGTIESIAIERIDSFFEEV